MKAFKDKTGVLIGGTSGMGLATAKMILGGGARLLVTGRSQAGPESAMTPMKRFGTPDEIAKAVLLLAFDATFAIAPEIPVEGGRSQS
jgi:NAD(P)-dependent dehydrogenase (short-subunit alcohol dehydrogenase family)